MDTLYPTVYTNPNTFCTCVHLCGGAFTHLCMCLSEAGGQCQASSLITPLPGIFLRFIYVYVCLFKFIQTIQIECLARNPQEATLSLFPQLWDYKHAPLSPIFHVGAEI